MNILLLIGGLILILLGANGLTDGAASVAKRFRIPPIVIGLTIVAFGTSAPELTVSVSSALKGSADIAIGNVVGSNIFNTVMIVGCTALFAPIVITRNTLRKEIPLCILSSIVLLICANDAFLDKAPENILNRVDGLLLLRCHFSRQNNLFVQNGVFHVSPFKDFIQYFKYITFINRNRNNSFQIDMFVIKEKAKARLLFYFFQNFLYSLILCINTDFHLLCEAVCRMHKTHRAN